MTDDYLILRELDEAIEQEQPDEAVEASGAAMENYDEEVVSTDSFEARFTFTVDEEPLTLTVNEGLSVIDATEHRASESA